MKRTVAAMLPAVALALSLTACGDGNDLTALGDLALLGECELPDGYTVVGLDEVLTTTDATACAWGGEKVMFRGTVKVTDVSTTAIACLGENQCCNCVTASFGFEDLDVEDARISIYNNIPDLDVRCEGTECDLFCYDLHEDHDYVVWGGFFCDGVHGPSGANTHDRSLSLSGFCKLSTDPTPTERFTNPNGNCGYL